MKKLLILGGMAALSVSLAACSDAGDDATYAEASESAAADTGLTGDMGGMTATDPAMGTGVGTSGMGDTTGATGGAAGTPGATTGPGTVTGADAGATTGAATGDGSTAGGAGTRP